MTVTNQNYNHKEAKSRINLGNVCYHLFKMLCLPISILNIMKKICKYIVLPVLYGCETCSFTLNGKKID